MNLDVSGSSAATVAVEMYYPTPHSTLQTTLIASTSSPSQSWNSTVALTPSSFRRCSIRNCPHFVAEQSSNKMCEACRSRHRIYASTKRARKKANNVANDDAAAEYWLGLNSDSSAQEIQPEALPTDLVSPVVHSISISPHDQPQTLPLSNWTQGFDPRLFSALSSPVALPLTSHSSSELANALVMPVSTKNVSVNEHVQSQIQATAALQLQGAAKDKAASPKNQSSTQDHLQGSSEEDEPVRVCSVRGCKQVMPDSSEYKMCPACRVRYQKYGTTKRARRKAKREQASLDVAAGTQSADPKSMPGEISNSVTTNENVKEGDKDEISPLASSSASNPRVSTDVSEKIGNSRTMSMSVGAHIAVDGTFPVRHEHGNIIQDHQVQVGDEESAARCHVEGVRSTAQSTPEFQSTLDCASRTAQRPPQRSTSENTIAVDPTIVTTPGHSNTLPPSVPQLQPHTTTSMQIPFASQPSSSVSTSPPAAPVAKHKPLSFIHNQGQIPSIPGQSYLYSDPMVKGFSKFRVELLESAKAALANNHPSQNHAEGGKGLVNGVGMVMAASDMSVRGGSSQVFGTGSASAIMEKNVVPTALCASEKDKPDTKVTSNTDAIVGFGTDPATDTSALPSDGENDLRMTDSVDKDTILDQIVKDSSQGQSQSTAPKTTTTIKSKAKKGTKAVAALPPNSHSYYYPYPHTQPLPHGYPPPTPYSYYPIYYPTYPGAYSYPYPYLLPSSASQSSTNGPGKNPQDQTSNKDKNGPGYGNGYGVGPPLVYAYQPPGSNLTAQTGMWAYPGPHPTAGASQTGSGGTPDSILNPPLPAGPSYAPYAMVRYPAPISLLPPPPPQANPTPPGSASTLSRPQYGPYQYSCGPQPYNGTPFPLGTPVMPVSYYSVGNGVGSSSGPSVSTTGSGRKDKGKQTEDASEDGKGRRIRQEVSVSIGGGAEGGPREGERDNVLNESLDVPQQEPKQMQMQFSYYHYGPDGSVETLSEGARKKRRKVDPNYLEKLEMYRAQARERERTTVVAAAVDCGDIVTLNRESISAAALPFSALAPVTQLQPVCSLKERQCPEEVISSTSTSTVNDANVMRDSSPELPVEEVVLTKRRCSNKTCRRHITIDDASHTSDDNQSMSGEHLCGKCRKRFDKIRLRTKMRFRLMPRRNVLDRLGRVK